MELAADACGDVSPRDVEGRRAPDESLQKTDTQTAAEFIHTQLQLEADAREALPFSFDTCTQQLGPLRQTVFSCLTCKPIPTNPGEKYIPAGVCYSCSISCHGEHRLVELFSRRNFVCDCGSTRLPSTSPCTLRTNPDTGAKGVHSQAAAKDNQYNHNFQNLFCGCRTEYDTSQEKGTMFQCLGLGTTESGGCGEDWWHPQCLMGLPRTWRTERIPDKVKAEQNNNSNGAADKGQAGDHGEDQAPPGFPDEDDFESMICYKCVASNPWIQQYAGANGFLPPLLRTESTANAPVSRTADHKLNTYSDDSAINGGSTKRRSSDAAEGRLPSTSKRVKTETMLDTEAQKSPEQSIGPVPPRKHASLPPAPEGTFSLFLREDFRDHLCHCPKCYPNLIPHPQLLEEEEVYEPPLSESSDSEAGPGSGARSHGTGSLLERGEAALSTMDRVRAIEGVMAYNHLKDKVKDFLKPFAESGRVVGAEDVKAYFEKLRGDDAATRETGVEADKDDGKGNHRREQSGY